jgi:4a-hydroxytetrahydrobiopterin dehydratase
MESTKNSLAEKNCVPCQGGVPPLQDGEIKLLLNELKSNWQINSFGHLWKKYTFSDFKSAMKFSNKIAALADKEGHHPNLLISWGNCEVEIWTHKINGLSPSDFYLAAKIDLTYLNRKYEDPSTGQQAVLRLAEIKKELKDGEILLLDE